MPKTHDGGTASAQRPTAAPSAVGGGGMFSDPVVKWMAALISLLVVGFLIFVVFSLALGYLRPAAPRTFTEAKISEGQSLIDSGVIEPEIWRNQLMLLIDSKQFAVAQNLIDKGEGIVDDSWGHELGWMQAELYGAQGRYDEALVQADETQAAIMAEYERVLASEDVPNRAKAYGISENHGRISLLKYRIHIVLEDYPEAQRELQVYIDANPTDAGILKDLAAVKILNGDLDGARADYDRVLMFLPDDPEALEGLESIGAE